MTMPDAAALLGLDETPKYADPASRRRGTLQHALSEQRHKRRRLAALIETLQADLAKTETAIAALERELGGAGGER